MGRNAIKKKAAPAVLTEAPVSSLTTPALPFACLHSPKSDSGFKLCVSECGRLAEQTWRGFEVSRQLAACCGNSNCFSKSPYFLFPS